MTACWGEKKSYPDVHSRDESIISSPIKIHGKKGSKGTSFNMEDGAAKNPAPTTGENRGVSTCCISQFFVCSPIIETTKDGALAIDSLYSYEKHNTDNSIRALVHTLLYTSRIVLGLNMRSHILAGGSAAFAFKSTVCAGG